MSCLSTGAPLPMMSAALDHADWSLILCLSPVCQGYRQWPNQIELSQDPTEPHPETTEPLVGLAPTLFLSCIVIHYRSFACATLSDSSEIIQHWGMQPGSKPKRMITFPILVRNCKLILSLFLVHHCWKNITEDHQSLDEPTWPINWPCSQFCIQQCFLNCTFKSDVSCGPW